MKQRQHRSWVRKHAGSLCLSTAVTLAMGGGAFALIGSASAEAMSDASATHVDVFWTPDTSATDVTTVDQVMEVERKIANGYWSMQVGFAPTANAKSNIAYMGLQTNSTRPDGTTGEMGIFSVWDADKSRNRDGQCVVFGGEGDGLSCRAALPFSTGTQYRYRVQRLEADSTGQWWGGWIRNMSTGDETYLGDLHNKNTFMTSSVINFSEYWGASVPCERLASSQVLWTQPAAKTDTADSTYAYHTAYGSMQHGECTKAAVVPVNLNWTKGVRVVAGADTSVATPPTSAAAPSTSAAAPSTASPSPSASRTAGYAHSKRPVRPRYTPLVPRRTSAVMPSVKPTGKILGESPVAGHPLTPAPVAS